MLQSISILQVHMARLGVIIWTSGRLMPLI